MIYLYRIASSALAAMLLIQCSIVSLSAQIQLVDTVVGDAKWQLLVALNAPPRLLSERPSASQNELQREQYHAEVVSHFLKIADEARNFRRDNPSHAKVRDAKVMEAENLLKAAMSGEKNLRTRIDPLVSAINSDKSISSPVRFKIAAMSEHILLRELAAKPEFIQTAREDSARYLIKEFPEEVGGYVTLLSAVRATNDVEKIKAATLEVTDSKAPFAAKAQARILMGRYELLGKSLADVANTALGRSNFFEKFRGRKIVLYTWSMDVGSSIAYAKALAVQVPQDTVLIGYNLDRNIAEAMARAKIEALPGEHYYNDGGAGGWLALLLKLDAPRLVYATDGAGIIRSVAAQTILGNPNKNGGDR